MEKKLNYRLLSKILIGLAITVPMILFISSFFNQTERRVCYMPQTNVVGVTEPIFDGRRFEQTFTAITDTITDIEIQIGTHQRTNQFQLTMELSDLNSGIVLFRHSIDTSKLVDNLYESIHFEPIKVKSGNTYVLSFFSEGAAEDNTISFYRTADYKTATSDYVIIDDRPQSYSLALRIYGEYNVLNLFTAIILLFLFCLLVVGIYATFILRLPIEKLVAIVAFPLGLFYLITVTPLAVPDEHHHYKSAYQLSNFIMFQWEKNDLGDSSDFDYSDYLNISSRRQVYIKILEEIDKPSIDGDEIKIPYPRSLAYFPEYLPQAFGIALCRVTGQNFIRTFLVGRLFNLIFYISCLYFAIKRIPKFKILLSLIGMMPMALQQAASLSYDCFINGLSLLLISSLLKAILETGKLSKKDFNYIFFSGILLAPAKVVYSLILLLTLLIPAERFGSRKKKIISLSLLLLTCLVFLGSIQFQGSNTASQLLYASSSDGTYSISFIFQHPISTIIIFVRSLWCYIGGWITGAVGTDLSYKFLSIPSWIILCYMLLILISTLNNDTSTCLLQRTTKTVSLLLSFFCTLSIMLAMFLDWTKYNSILVDGVQGRYFIPIFPLLTLPVNNTLICLKKDLDRPLFFSALLLHASIVITVLQ